jgi:hypothetical protein
VSWSKRFDSPIALKDGRLLKTLRDAGELIAAFPADRQAFPPWTYAAELLLAAARSGRREAIADAWAQVRRAASVDGLAAR